MMAVPGVAPRVAATNDGGDFDLLAPLQAQDDADAVGDHLLRADQHEMQAARLERHAIVRWDSDLSEVPHFVDAVLDGRYVQFDALVIGALGADDGLIFIASIHNRHVSRVNGNGGWRPRHPGILDTDAFGR